MDNFYPENEAEQEQESAQEQEPAAPDETKEHEEAEGETALLPKSLFGGEVEVGKTYTVKVVRGYDDEVEVSLNNDEEAEPGESTMGMAEGKLDEMAG